jgi:Domain of unknown function (DUF4266)
MKQQRRWIVIVVAGVHGAVLSGCALQPPRPWEKGNLARKAMTMESDPLDQAFQQHVYFSKESASGGYGVGGGGCGCN